MEKRWPDFHVKIANNTIERMLLNEKKFSLRQLFSFLFLCVYSCKSLAFRKSL
jgi:hypothetical protein